MKNPVIGEVFNTIYFLRDLIAKKGEKSPPKFLADFLFSTPFKTTYPGVLEII